MQETRIEPTDGLSYVRGDFSPVMVPDTLSSLLDRTVRRFPDRTAAVFREHGVRWTWKELQREADSLAMGLLSLGLKAGDRVAIWSPNRPEWLVAQFATARLGLILVNINPAYRLAELEYALNLAQCRAIISADVFKTSQYLEMIRILAPEIGHAGQQEIQAARLPHLKFVIRMGQGTTRGMIGFDSLLAKGRAALDLAALDAITSGLDPHDPVNIQFTSGTTGNAKGATLTHYAVCNNARFSSRELRFTENDVLCIPIPLYHAFGMVLAGLLCVATGAAMVFPGEAFDPVVTMEAIQAERCTAMHCVPMMLISILGHPQFGEFDLSSLRTGMMAGAPCPVETMKRVVSDMHMREVTIAFGMTETSGAIFQSGNSDSLDRRVSTVGRILPHLEAKVVDVAGTTLPVGEKGELCVKGYTVLRGYWGDAARTKQAIVDGWLHTGDLATIDAQGYCNIVGRAKDMLIRGGENVYPREVEEFLFRHPKVQTVQVFGVPDERFGEEVCAWIILKPGSEATAEEIREFCKDQISHYKIPRYVRFVSEMPMTITGKVQKFVMRDAMIKELQAKSA
ncbi:AMP-binding protein [Variovorax defluvii]|uniref:AMP-binding protein n=1 Tax=Variovorax defluvii TaxID=913761 RepID=A0ABP8GVY4_9BURK